MHLQTFYYSLTGGTVNNLSMVEQQMLEDNWICRLRLYERGRSGGED